VDAAMLAISGLAVIATSPTADVPVEGAGWLVGFGLLILSLLAVWGAYRPRIGLSFLEDIRAIVTATALAAMTVTFIRVLFTNDPNAAAQATREWLFSAVYLSAGRGAFHLADLRARRQGTGGRPTIVIGAGAVGQLIARRLLARPEIGLRPVFFLDPDPPELEGSVELPVIGSAEGLEVLVADHRIEHAIISFSNEPHQSDAALARRLEMLGVGVSVVPRLFELLPDQMTLERVEGMPLVSIHPANPSGWQFSLKYVADRVVALFLLLLLSPVLVCSAIGIWITLGRPILFRQLRVGRDGQGFEMLKFRTMKGAPEEHGEADADWAGEVLGEAPDRNPEVSDEDRTTRLTRLLRGLGIDELPQLLNVVRGEMSLVGPRPERLSYAEMFDEKIARYSERHRVKSGITGWAQVNGLRGKTSLSDRVEWDNYYIENWSLWLDFKILLLTPRALLRGRQ
jgi:exopolysaccharide biosynthesis polyprenyl glycosylphosphotransferase